MRDWISHHPSSFFMPTYGRTTFHLFWDTNKRLWCFFLSLNSEEIRTAHPIEIRKGNEVCGNRHNRSSCTTQQTSLSNINKIYLLAIWMTFRIVKEDHFVTRILKYISSSSYPKNNRTGCGGVDKLNPHLTKRRKTKFWIIGLDCNQDGCSIIVFWLTILCVSPFYMSVYAIIKIGKDLHIYASHIFKI